MESLGLAGHAMKRQIRDAVKGATANSIRKLNPDKRALD